MAPLSLTVLEIIILQIGAVVLGMAIYFFFSSEKNLIQSSPENIEKLKKQINDWKQKFLNESEIHERELIKVKAEVFKAEDLRKKSLHEIEDLNWKITDLENRIEDLKSEPVEGENPDYFQQLSNAGNDLRDHSEKITELLAQVNLHKELEAKMQQLIRENEALQTQLSNLESFNSKKDIELKKKTEKEEIYTEISSMVDIANVEFKVLKEKIQKLEAQLIDTQMDNLDFENLKESNQRLTKDQKELAEEYKRLAEKNNLLSSELSETIDKLKESNFQRLQLQKKVNYMEELKNDLRIMSESNRSLEGQMSRISELESMLNILSQERKDSRNDEK
jgi:chromosome segregation ATPase